MANNVTYETQATWEAMEFTALLPNGDTKMFTFWEYYKWRKSLDYTPAQRDIEELISWLQADNLNRVSAWLSLQQVPKK